MTQQRDYWIEMAHGQIKARKKRATIPRLMRESRPVLKDFLFHYAMEVHGHEVVLIHMDHILEAVRKFQRIKKLRKYGRKRKCDGNRVARRQEVQARS